GEGHAGGGGGGSRRARGRAGRGRRAAHRRHGRARPARPGAPPLLSGAVRWVRSAPGTYIYLAVLLATAWVLDSSNSKLAHRLVLERSTNLHELAEHPVRVLVESAFWVAAPWNALVWGVLFTLVLAPAEHWLGTARWVFILAVGHVGATIVTAAGLWLAVRADAVEPSLTHPVRALARSGLHART